MKKKQKIILGAAVAILLVSIIIIVAVINQRQDVRSRAQVPSNTADACVTPAGIQNVSIEYPNPNSDNTGFIYNEANCSWTALSDATSYTVTVTEVETGIKVKDNVSVSTGTTKIVFAVNNGKTYKCDVAAVNSCGTSGPIGTDTKLCQTSFGISPTPTPVAPTATPIVPTPTTPIGVPTATPTPTTPIVAPTATPIVPTPTTPFVAPTATPVVPTTIARVIIPTNTPAPIMVPGNQAPIAISITGAIIMIIGTGLFLLAGL